MKKVLKLAAYGAVCLALGGGAGYFLPKGEIVTQVASRVVEKVVMDSKCEADLKTCNIVNEILQARAEEVKEGLLELRPLAERRKKKECLVIIDELLSRYAALNPTEPEVPLEGL